MAFLDPIRRRLQTIVIGSFRRFGADRCTILAGSLAFTTLLAVVPMATIAFGLFSFLPSFRDLLGSARRMVFESFVPGIGDVVDAQLDVFIANASSLPLIGLGALFITSALLVWEIETSFNAIWKPDQPNSWRVRLLVIWATITGMPVIAALTAWTIAFMMEAGGAVLGWAGGYGGRILSLALSWAVFFVAYTVLPARSVPRGPAAVGALVAAVLFAVAKSLFVTYVAISPLQSLIYGVLAALPLFQIWIYILWAIVLFGACVAAEIESASDASARNPAPDGTAPLR
ncbi:MAG: YihY family inner membrane protein [Elsteraceae bacterium]